MMDKNIKEELGMQFILGHSTFTSYIPNTCYKKQEVAFITERFNKAMCPVSMMIIFFVNAKILPKTIESSVIVFITIILV